MRLADQQGSADYPYLSEVWNRILGPKPSPAWEGGYPLGPTEVDGERPCRG